MIAVRFDVTPRGWSGYDREAIGATIADLIAKLQVESLNVTRHQILAHVLPETGQSVEQLEAQVDAWRAEVQRRHPHPGFRTIVDIESRHADMHRLKSGKPR